MFRPGRATICTYDTPARPNCLCPRAGGKENLLGGLRLCFFLACLAAAETVHPAKDVAASISIRTRLIYSIEAHYDDHSG